MSAGGCSRPVALWTGRRAASPSTRLEREAKASSILCWECSRISSITSEPVEKRSISDSFTRAGCVSEGVATDTVEASSIVGVVVAAFGGFELSSKPSIQTTVHQLQNLQKPKQLTYRTGTRHR
jgi:hypothetical protein